MKKIKIVLKKRNDFGYKNTVMLWYGRSRWVEKHLVSSLKESLILGLNKRKSNQVTMVRQSYRHLQGKLGEYRHLNICYGPYRELLLMIQIIGWKKFEPPISACFYCTREIKCHVCHGTSKSSLPQDRRFQHFCISLATSSPAEWTLETCPQFLQDMEAPLPSREQCRTKVIVETTKCIGKLRGSLRTKIISQAPGLDSTETRVAPRDQGHPLQGEMWVNSNSSYDLLNFKFERECIWEDQLVLQFTPWMVTWMAAPLRQYSVRTWSFSEGLTYPQRHTWKENKSHIRWLCNATELNTIKRNSYSAYYATNTVLNISQILCSLILRMTL